MSAEDRDAGEDVEARVAEVTAAVSAAIERLAFNVALARLMELTDHLRTPASKRIFVRLLAPLAPHLAEERWHVLGGPFSVHEQEWPEPEPSRVVAPTELAVQIDGRTVATASVEPIADRTAAEEAARHEVAGLPDAAATRQVVYVPGRVINFVTRGR